jgi:hypothetical protein
MPVARIVNRPISVTLVGGRPAQFMYARERHVVASVLDTWLEAGRWWEQENETQTWRIQTVKGGVFELMQDLVTKQWILYKAYD